MQHTDSFDCFRIITRPISKIMNTKAKAEAMKNCYRLLQGIVACFLSFTVSYSPIHAAVGLVVNKDLYSYIKPWVDQYIEDIERIEKKDVWYDVCTFDERSDAGMLREVLRGQYEKRGLEGVVFIGDLPIVKFIDGDNYFVTDYYFMDLDGDWDADTAYHFNAHTGATKMEIWVSRITPSVLERNVKYEEEIIACYFQRVHRRMYGLDTLQRTLLVFGNNEEWPVLENENMTSLDYGKNAITNYTRPNDTKSTWIDELCKGHEYIFLYEHSHETAHALSDEQFTVEDYLKRRTNGRFYNLFACSAANYTRENFGGYYALTHGGLICIGSAKPGSMLPESYIYYNRPLNDGECFGEAFRKWANAAGVVSPSWHYGMILQGAGTIRLQPYETVSIQNTDQKQTAALYTIYPTMVTAGMKVYCTVKKTLPASDAAGMTVYALNGTKIFSTAIHGNHYIWNVKTTDGRYVPSGMYIVQIHLPHAVSPIVQKTVTVIR